MYKFNDNQNVNIFQRIQLVAPVPITFDQLTSYLDIHYFITEFWNKSI